MNDFERRIEKNQHKKVIYKKIKNNNTKLGRKIDENRRLILTAFKRDNRKSKHWNDATKALSDILWAGLKSIPVCGGYFGLALTVLKDPLKGGYEIARTSHGDKWNPPGSNGVMSPLGPGDKSFNYANGRVDGFTDDRTLKAEQFESDVFDMVNTSGVYRQSHGVDMTSSQVKVDTLDEGTGGIEYLKWRLGILEDLNKCDTESWTWYNIALCTTSMLAEHEGLDDLIYGVFNIGDDDNPKLAEKDTIKKIQKHHKMSSRYSNLHVILKQYVRPTYPELPWVGPGKGTDVILSPSTLYRVECAKALVVAYQGEVRKSLAEVVSKHLYTIINNHAGTTESDALVPLNNIDDNKDIREREHIKNQQKVKLTAPLRLVGAVMPKAIYNSKTTYESKKWARFLSAVSVFYSILHAYFDKQFVCDELPSRRSLTFFLVAYTDALNTSMEYFCHKSNTGGYRKNAAMDLKNTIKSLLQVDPGISVFLDSAVHIDVSDVEGQPPGLQGFKHLNTCPRSTVDLRSLNSDVYSIAESVKMSDTQENVRAIQDARSKKRIAEQQEILKAGHQALSKGWAGGSISRHEVSSPEKNYQSTLSAVVSDQDVPSSVQSHLVDLCRLLKAKGIFKEE